MEKACSEQVKGKVVVVKVDNKVLFHIYKKGDDQSNKLQKTFLDASAG